MTPATFQRWMRRHGLTYPRAAEKLGISRQTVQRYLAGTTKISRPVALACAAIDAGLPPLS